MFFRSRILFPACIAWMGVTYLHCKLIYFVLLLAFPFSMRYSLLTDVFIVNIPIGKIIR